MSFTDIVRVAKALFQTTAALHAAGVVHRDIKPGNIMITEFGPVLMDLGVVSGSTLPEQTQTSAFLGTIAYAAPEYLFGEEYDSRIDVYSTGTILWEMLSGRPLFPHEMNWARVIVGKAMIPVLGYDEVARHQGHSAALFAYLALRRMFGAKESRPTASEMSAFMETVVWTDPFYVSGTKIAPGYPTVRGSFGSTTFHEGVEIWRRECSPEILTRLVGLITQGYAERPDRADVTGGLKIGEPDALVKLGIIEKYDGIGGMKYYCATAAADFAFRYGLLPLDP